MEWTETNTIQLYQLKRLLWDANNPKHLSYDNKVYIVDINTNNIDNIL